LTRKFQVVSFDKIGFIQKKIFGSGALSGKMLLARIFENNKIDDYFRAG